MVKFELSAESSPQVWLSKGWVFKNRTSWGYRN